MDLADLIMTPTISTTKVENENKISSFEWFLFTIIIILIIGLIPLYIWFYYKLKSRLIIRESKKRPKNSLNRQTCITFSNDDMGTTTSISSANQPINMGSRPLP